MFNLLLVVCIFWDSKSWTFILYPDDDDDDDDGDDDDDDDELFLWYGWPTKGI